MDDMELYAYGDDVSDLRRQLGEDPLPADESDTAGYSESLERSAFSDDDSDVDDSLSDQSDASFAASTSPSVENRLLELHEDDLPWEALEDSEKQQNLASTKRILALTSPRGSHRTHEILSGQSTPKSADVEEPLSHAERKALKKARRKSLHATAHSLSKAVAHLKEAHHKAKSRGHKEHPHSARTSPPPPMVEKPHKLKRGRSRSLTKDLEAAQSKQSASSQSSDSGGSSADLKDKSRSHSPASSSGSQDVNPSDSLKHTSSTIRPPVVVGPSRSAQNLVASSGESSTPNVKTSGSFNRSPSDPLHSGQQPPPLAFEKFDHPKGASVAGSGKFMAILHDLQDEKKGLKSAASSSSDLFSSSGHTRSFSSSSSLPDEEPLMLFVSPDTGAPARRPIDLGLSSSTPPQKAPKALRDSFLALAAIDPRLQRYREVLDLFNGPQLEALLRMMDDFLLKPSPVASSVLKAAAPAPPPEIDLYVGEETPAAALHAPTHVQVSVAPLAPAATVVETSDHSDTNSSVSGESWKGWKDAMASELDLRRELVSVKNWNEEFQRILRMPQGELNTFSLLRSLGQDFVFTAETYGRIIISEMHLSPAEKTIKPAKIGGVAGPFAPYSPCRCPFDPVFCRWLQVYMPRYFVQVRSRYASPRTERTILDVRRVFAVY